MQFEGRLDAGRQLASKLKRVADRDPIVVALPRGGVPVAYEIAHELSAPLDVLIVRKLGAPGHSEFGIGAIAQGGGSYLNVEAVARMSVSREYLDAITRAELAEIERRLHAYRGRRPTLAVRDRTVIVVDDGLATGATMRAAIRSLRKQAPRALILAVPVCAADMVAELRSEVDELYCTFAPRHFHAVGDWYEDFRQTSDAEVIELLERREREYARELS